MEELLTTLKGKKIYDLRNNFVARVKAVVIDPLNGKLLALTCNPVLKHSNQSPKSPPRSFIKKNIKKVQIIIPQDIKSWDQSKIALFNAYELHDSADVIRVDRILKNGLKIKGNKVITESGDFLGYVKDILINTEALMLAAIIVKKKLFKLFFSQTKIIHYKNIVEIKPKVIIVKDAMIKIPILENSTEKLSGVPAQPCNS